MATRKPKIKLAGRSGRHTVTKSGTIIRTIPHGGVSQTASFKRAVAHSIAATKKNGNPVARYDVQRRQAYLEYPDGKRAYVE